MSRKLTINLTDEAGNVLDALCERWGGMSMTAGLETLLRRTGGLPPFDNLERDRVEILRQMMNAGPSPEESQPEAGPVTPEQMPGQKSAEVFVTPAEPTVEKPDEDEVPEPEHAVEEPAPEPAPTNMAGGRVFTRNWYDDGAPEWVQVLGADATSGLELTPAQLAALNDWQAGIDRDPPTNETPPP